MLNPASPRRQTGADFMFTTDSLLEMRESAILAFMSDIPFMVLRLQDQPGKFTVVVLNSEPYGLSPHSEFSELEVRRFLASAGQSAPQIELLMQRAQEAPEFNAPPFIVGTFHKG
ncbi:MAG: hypothetical protein WBY44_11980 [Bryobacteraceae bacterium]